MIGPGLSGATLLVLGSLLHKENALSNSCVPDYLLSKTETAVGLLGCNEI